MNQHLLLMNDLEWLDLLLRHLSEGAPHLALRALLKTPSATYPDVQHPLVKSLINYLDAGAFGTRGEAYLALKELTKQLEDDVALTIDYEHLAEILDYEERLLYYSILHDHPSSIETIHPEIPTLTALERGLKTLNDKNIHALVDFAPEPYRPLMKRRIEMIQRWGYSSLTSLINFDRTTLFQLPLPWIPFSYPTALPFPVAQGEETLVLLIEPYEEGWEAFLTAIQQRRVIFVFESTTALVQIFQFPAFVERLEEECTSIYLLDRYPSQQTYKALLKWPLQSYARFPVEEKFQQFCEDLSCASDDDIYQAALKLRFAVQKHRLGTSKIFPLLLREGCRMWQDEHKIPGYTEEEFSRVIDKESEGHLLPRRRCGSGKLKVAHIVPQVVDGGHAPSRLLETILSYHDKDKFDLYLFSTEPLLLRQGEYPYNIVASDSSSSRGRERLSRLQNLGVKVWIDDGKLPLVDTAFKMVELLRQEEIDIAVFHGPDLINLLCSRCCDVPLKVLFDHGTPSTYPAFDLVIFSALTTQKKHEKALEALGIAHELLPFSVDSRQGWAPAPYVRHQLGLPQDGFLMTTISNHLDTRLGKEMCQAIAEILQKCPLAYYAPIGNIINRKRLMQIFYDNGVDDKVFLLGNRPEPSQYARSMQLYLNEFPFGSGLGVLDAMAAGCPVITMSDPEGPPQANYGALYFGEDKAVKSGDIEGYVHLACSLYEDSQKHERWSAEALKKYEERGNSKEYIKNLEEILLKQV